MTMAARPDFEAVFDLSPNPYMVLDRGLRFVAANRAYLRATSRTLEELLGRQLFDEFPHDPHEPANASRAMLRDSLERVLVTGRPDSIALIPYRIAHGDAPAEIRQWSATHTPILDRSGQVQFILQHTVDVTEVEALRHAAARAGVLARAEQVQQRNVLLDEERRHLRSLFEQAPGFICILRGSEHVIELANRAYFQLLGHRELLGRTVREAVPEVAGQGWFEQLDRVYATGEPLVGQGARLALQKTPGAPLEEVFVDFVYQPILDQRGRVAGIFVQGNDVTSQKRLEEERFRLLASEQDARARAEEARDELHRRAELEQQLIAIVSHDLRNPLQAIALSASLLLRYGHLDPSQGKAVARIVSSTERATRLIGDFLDFTRARSTGHLPVAPAWTNLREIARQVVDEIGLANPERVLTLTHEGEENGVWDADRIAQVIGNLVGNAVQHSPASGAVRVVTSCQGGHTEIAVHNEGPPIPAADLSRLFEPFVRGRDAGGGRDRSVGLGLYISKEIVAAHGGTIAVRSDPGFGTQFTVRLPRTALTVVREAANVR